MTAGEIFFRLLLDKGNFDSDLERSEDSAKNFSKNVDKAVKGVSKTFGTLSKIGAAALGTVAGAIAGLGGLMLKSVSTTTEYGDKVDKMAQKIGISNEAFQEWAYVMDLAGGDINSLNAGMRTLSKVLVDASEGSQSAYEALEAVGLEAEDFDGLTLEESLNLVMEALGDMESGAERTTAATALLGRGAMDLAPLLNMTAEEIEAAKQEAHELGMIMSDEDVKASADYQDSLTRMKGALRGLTMSFTTSFIPMFTKIANGFTKIAKGSDDGVDDVIDGFTSMAKELGNKIPEFLEIGGKIVESLIQGIMDNLDSIINAAMAMIESIVTQIITMLPELAKSAINIVFTLVDKIIELLPELMDASLKIIFALADGLIEALPDLIPAVIEIITTLIMKLTEPDTVFRLIQAAGDIIIALAKGLISALPQLQKNLEQIGLNILQVIGTFSVRMAQKGWELLKNLISGITDNLQKVKEGIGRVWDAITGKISGWWDKAKGWGKDLLDNFVQGIKDKIQKVKETVGNIGQSIKDLLGFSEPKEGPLSNFHTYAPDMMELFAKGVKDNENLITAQIERSFDIEANLRNASGMTSGGSGIASGATYSEAPINITVQSVLDGRILGESLYKYQRTQKKVYGR